LDALIESQSPDAAALALASRNRGLYSSNIDFQSGLKRLYELTT
jgi:hypothetical protein